MLPQDTRISADAKAAREGAYDVVVVGAGMGGLTAGALLARAGQKVLVVEANEQPGGFTRALRRGAYSFDLADHLLMECGTEGPFGPGIIDSVLRHLEVRARCEFVRVHEPFYTTRFPGFSLAVPGGRERFLDAHLRHFPGEARGLHHLVDLGSRLARELRALPIESGLMGLLRFPHAFPTAFHFRKATVQEVVDHELTDPRLKEAYLTFQDWVAFPPPGSFPFWAAMMANYVEDGAYYCRGSFQRLADAVAEGLTLAGGELLLNTRVTHIDAQARRVKGVLLESGQHVAAPTVIAGIDARETFQRLLGPEQLPPAYLRRLRALELSGCAVMQYLATDLDARALGATHETAISTDWDPVRRDEQMRTGRISRLWIGIPSLTDPSLAPPGEHVVILTAPILVPADALAGEAEHRMADEMLELAERVLPGLRSHLTYVEGATPGATKRLPLQLRGPIYGWGTSPRQVGMRRLSQRTPVAGLYLVGHWTRPAHGVSTVMQSGVQIARFVLGAATHASALPLRLPVAQPAT